MERALARARAASASTPLGYRSPSADLSAATLGLLEENGFLYDSSLMADDYRPFHPRIGDRVARGVPLERGREARFWELPMCFELDDWLHFQFNFEPYRRAARRRAGARDLAGGVRLDGRERRRRRAHLLHAPAGDRPRPPDGDARRADRPLPRRRRALRAHGRRRARPELSSRSGADRTAAPVGSVSTAKRPTPLHRLGRDRSRRRRAPSPCAVAASVSSTAK